MSEDKWLIDIMEKVRTHIGAYLNPADKATLEDIIQEAYEDGYADGQNDEPEPDERPRNEGMD
jgi:hypothetical protein